MIPVCPSGSTWFANGLLGRLLCEMFRYDLNGSRDQPFLIEHSHSLLKAGASLTLVVIILDSTTLSIFVLAMQLKCHLKFPSSAFRNEYFVALHWCLKDEAPGVSRMVVAF